MLLQIYYLPRPDVHQNLKQHWASVLINAVDNPHRNYLNPAYLSAAQLPDELNVLLGYSDRGKRLRSLSLMIAGTTWSRLLR